MLIILTALVRLYKYKECRYISVISVIYSAFCFITYGKIAGFIATQSIENLISQYGYDPTRLPVSLAGLITYGLIGGGVFNLFTSIWIWMRWGFWKYCLTVVVLFCLAGLGIGPFVGLSPIFSLFGLCCGFMASVAWVLGLTYVEFCVISNFYVPALAVILAAVYMIYSCITTNNNIIKGLILLFGLAQISTVILLLWHYFGSYSAAFSLCVKDLIL